MPSPKDYQDRILADRYAQKDTTSEVRIGDRVVSSITRKFEKDGEEIESRELGKVVSSNDDQGTPLYDVALIDRTKDEQDWEVVRSLERPQIEVLVETCYEDIAKRVAAGVIENEPKNTDFRDAVYKAMVNREFVPAGRILAGLGCKDKTLTFFNCYVFPPPHDSREGIAKHWGMLFNTFSLGGGVGWDNSSHRPRGALVRKVNGRSSGAVSWMEQYSQITGAVEQGGSRRGASLMGLWCWHPDIVEFIQAKSQRESFVIDGKRVSRSKELLKNANISVLISADFMEAVEKDADWQLVFPDMDHPSYNKTWNGDLKQWKEEGKPVTTYKTVKAQWLWNLIIDHAWTAGEPGLLFMERANAYSNSYYYNKISCTNPCGEICLPPFGVCNLGHINLSKFILGGVEHIPANGRTFEEALGAFDLQRFKEVVTTGVRFLDNVTDLNNYHMSDNKKLQTNERRTGLGILGYGELLVRLGLRYGSYEALDFTDWLFGKLAEYSYKASVELAEERGSFPALNVEKFLSSGFMKTMLERFPELAEAITTDGIRNVTLNTVAPTGSVGTMLGTTTGIEPYFLAAWIARSRIGSVDEEANILVELKKKFGDNLPSYFVTTQDINPEEHVRTQATAQKWIDASISKTINLPNNATRADVAGAYELMYKLGCKGGTVYRDGSRDKQVLYYKDDKNEVAQKKVKAAVPVEVVDEYKQGGAAILRPKIDSGIGVTMSKQTPVGRLHGTLRMHHKTGKPYDLFLISGKGDISADVQALGRLISVILRMPDGEVIPQEMRLEIIRDQLHRIPGRGQTGWGPDKVMSLPDGIAQMLNDYLSGNFPMANVPMGEDQVEEFLEKFSKNGNDTNEEMVAWIANDCRESFPEADDTEKENIIGLDFDICSQCGNATLVNVPGKCPYCITCMHTEC